MCDRTCDSHTSMLSIFSIKQEPELDISSDNDGDTELDIVSNKVDNDNGNFNDSDNNTDKQKVGNQYFSFAYILCRMNNTIFGFSVLWKFWLQKCPRIPIDQC